VRVTHLPTGLRAESHSERSQHRNHENAIRLLRGMLWLRGREAPEIDLVRSYALHPRRFVLDQRGVERQDVEAVLDGDLDDFLRARLGG
jgi:peptide chain release factor 2